MKYVLDLGVLPPPRRDSKDTFFHPPFVPQLDETDAEDSKDSKLELEAEIREQLAAKPKKSIIKKPPSKPEKPEDVDKVDKVDKAPELPPRPQKKTSIKESETRRRKKVYMIKPIQAKERINEEEEVTPEETISTVFTDPKPVLKQPNRKTSKFDTKSSIIPRRDINYESYKKLNYALEPDTETNKNFLQYLQNPTSNNFLRDLQLVNSFKVSLFDDSSITVNSLDLVLEWFVIRFSEINPYFNCLAIDYLIILFELLDNLKYRLTDHQANLLFPFLIEQFCDTRQVIRDGIHAILRQGLFIYDDIKMFDLILKVLNNTEHKIIQSECIEALRFLIRNFGIQTYNPAESLNSIGKFIFSKSKLVSISALSILALTIVKYGTNVAYFLRSEYIDVVEKELEYNFETYTNIAETKEDITDWYKKTMKSLQKKLELINEDMLILGKFESFGECVDLMLVNDIGFRVTLILNINSFLLDKSKNKNLIPYIDEIISKCSQLLTDAALIYIEDRDDKLNAELIQMITVLISVIFQNNLGRRTGFEQLRAIFDCLITLNVMLSVEDDLNSTAELALVKTLQYSDPTMCLRALIRILNGKCLENGKLHNGAVIDLVLNSIWVKLKGYDGNNEKLDTQIVDQLNSYEILFEVNFFLQKNPTDGWKRIESNLTLNIVDSVIEDIVRIKKKRVLEDLDKLELPDQAELRVKVNEFLKKTKNSVNF